MSDIAADDLWKVRRRSRWTRRQQLLRVLWSIVQVTLFRFSFHKSYRWRRFLLRLFGAKIGRQCTFRRTVRVYYPWNLEMGDMGSMGDDVVIYNLGKITLGRFVKVAQE